MEPIIKTFESRKKHMCVKGEGIEIPACDKASIPGTVTQRTCVYGGARIVLMPITDSIHLVHGPIGCAACTWDIRGSKSSKEDMYKKGCSTNLKEKDIIFGGEKKLFETVLELNEIYHPGAIFVYATCVSGIIGDDIKAVCKKAEQITGCRIIPVQSEGYQNHNKTKGHWIGGDALLDHVIGTKEPDRITEYDINVVGEFNVAGDLWGIKPLIESMGINIISTMTGDSRVDEIAQAHRAKLNIVQCQKSSNYIAKKMEKQYGIPYLKVNFFGLQQTVNSLRDIADFFNDEEMIERTEKIIQAGLKDVGHKTDDYIERLTGKTVALYVGGNKAWSLVRAFEELGMEVMMSGTKNGIKEDYERIKETVKDGTIIVDDANSTELARLLKKYRPNLLISGAKEKYISLKLGIPFCDFNHDRISAFAGFKGFISFAKEVDASVNSPVFNLTPKIILEVLENESS